MNMSLEQVRDRLRSMGRSHSYSTRERDNFNHMAEAIDAELAKQREAVPVAQVRVTNAGVIWRHDNAAAKSLGIGDHFLYTHPQQREAEPIVNVPDLSDEEDRSDEDWFFDAGFGED